MNPFINEQIRETTALFSGQHFQFERSRELQVSFAHIFSRHLGNLAAGEHFEAEGILVTGEFGSGKTKEVSASYF